MFVIEATSKNNEKVYRTDRKRFPDRNLNFSSRCLLDFEKLAETYDAIEVSISDDFELYYQLYGWDCNSIVIMNPKIIVELEEI